MTQLTDAETRLRLLKKHSPDTYIRYTTHRKHEIHSRLDILRGRYKDAPPEEKIRITDEANELKEELTLYE